MTDLRVPPSEGAGFVPTAEDTASVLDWFARYDAYALEANLDRMAEMALFPINVVTTGADGSGSAQSWDRDRFVAEMAEQLGGGQDVKMESTRTPVFLSANLVFVVTDATITAGEYVQTVRYGDLLVKSGGQWAFQTMVQGGWGES